MISKWDNKAIFKLPFLCSNCKRGGNKPVCLYPKHSGNDELIFILLLSVDISLRSSSSSS